MNSSPRRLTCLILILAVCSGLLSACGQKGPLYLPEPVQDEQEQTDG